MSGREDTHSLAVGYVLWIFGFTGAHRFYFGKPISGTLYLLTAGFFLIGWIIDLFLIPGMTEDASERYPGGDEDYNLVWILLVVLGVFGVHRFYQGKVISGLVYLFTLGVFGLGILYDLFTLNDQIAAENNAAYR